MKALGIPATLRLKSNREVKRVLYSGGKIHAGILDCYLLARNDALWRFGCQARKKIGPAVLRNRAKRLLREAVRMNKQLMPKGHDLFFVITAWNKAWRLDKMQKIVQELFQKPVPA